MTESHHGPATPLRSYIELPFVEYHPTFAHHMQLLAQLTLGPVRVQFFCPYLVNGNNGLTLKNQCDM